MHAVLTEYHSPGSQMGAHATCTDIVSMRTTCDHKSHALQHGTACSTRAFQLDGPCIGPLPLNPHISPKHQLWPVASSFWMQYTPTHLGGSTQAVV